MRPLSLRPIWLRVNSLSDKDAASLHAFDHANIVVMLIFFSALVEKEKTHLVHFLPALGVRHAVDRVVVEQRLAQHRRRSRRHGDPQRRESPGVAEVGRGAEVEQRAQRFQVVLLGGAVQRRRAALGAVIEKRPAVDQRQKKRLRIRTSGGQSERRLCVNQKKSSAANWAQWGAGALTDARPLTSPSNAILKNKKRKKDWRFRETAACTKAASKVR